MIQIESDGLSINVPVKRHMKANDFLALADKLQKIQTAQQMKNDSPAAFTLDYNQELHNIQTKLADINTHLHHQQDQINTILDYIDAQQRRR